jgi:hypothetical protein
MQAAKICAFCAVARALDVRAASGCRRPEREVLFLFASGGRQALLR